MSVYAIILTGLMIGSGPEMVSDAIEQGLDLSGEWEGVRKRSGGKIDRFFIDLGEAWAEPLVVRRLYRSYPRDFNVVDEGKGKLRWQWEGFDSACLGIYRWDNHDLVLCLGEPGKGRPTSFKAGDGQTLLILHRVKPRK